MEIFILALVGLSVGLVSSFFGIGGGSIIIPVLYSLYTGAPPSVIIPISLGAIFIVTFINIIRFSKQKLLPPKNVILNFFIFCSIGSLIGTKVVYLIDNSMAKFAMAIILLLMVFKLLFFKASTNPEEKSFKHKLIPFSFTGLIGSFISSITGLGGGIIFTPFFLNILKVPTKRVSPYSNLAMFITTLIGVIPHFFIGLKVSSPLKSELLERFFIGNVNLGAIVIISTFAFVTSSIGVKLNNLVSSKNKKHMLAFILLIFSIKLFISN